MDTDKDKGGKGPYLHIQTLQDFQVVEAIERGFVGCKLQVSLTQCVKFPLSFNATRFLHILVIDGVI